MDLKILPTLDLSNILSHIRSSFEWFNLNYSKNFIVKSRRYIFLDLILCRSNWEFFIFYTGNWHIGTHLKRLGSKELEVLFTKSRN